MLRKLFTMFVFSATVGWAVMGQQVFGRTHILEIMAQWQQQKPIDLANFEIDPKAKKAMQATWQQVKQQVMPKLAEQVAEQVKAQAVQQLSHNTVAQQAFELAQLNTEAGTPAPEGLQCIPTHVFAMRYGLAQAYVVEKQYISYSYSLASL